jgi:hypothetical protein
MARRVIHTPVHILRQGAAILRAALGVEGCSPIVELLHLLHLDGDTTRIVDAGLIVVDDRRRDCRLVARFRVAGWPRLEGHEE